MSKYFQKPRILVILGPTASGKSDLAVKIALQLSSGQAKKLYNINGAEIISADSRQVYKGLDIGAGKVPRDKISNYQLPITNYYYKGIPHYLLDVANPKRIFTVSQYQRLGHQAIKKILNKNKLPIICGGTGLYIDALIYNYQFPAIPPQKKLRDKLEKKTTKELFNQLKKLDPKRAVNIDRYNKRRLIRAIEIIIATGKPISKLEKSSPYDILKIGIKKNSDELKILIEKRLKKRLKQEMIEEVKNLHKKGLTLKRLDSFGLEYRYISRYLQQLITEKEMVALIKKESWLYVKRQLTWFKKDKNIIWINTPQEAFSKCQDWLGL